MARRKARECAFKVLFQVDQVEADPAAAFRYILEDVNLTEREKAFSWDLITGTLQFITNIDNKVAGYARDWAIHRMPAVDRNIMRLATFEILYMEDSQPVVAIDEALEIAKKYGDENSSSFINAILDRIMGEVT